MLRRKISPQEIKRVTGIPTKAEALRLTKIFKLRVNSKLVPENKKIPDLLRRLDTYTKNRHKNNVIKHILLKKINDFNEGKIDTVTINNGSNFDVYTLSKKKYNYDLDLDYVDLLELIHKLKPKQNELIQVDVEEIEEPENSYQRFFFKNSILDPKNHGHLIKDAMIANQYRLPELQRKFSKEELKLVKDLGDYYTTPDEILIQKIIIQRLPSIHTTKKREGAFFKHVLINNAQNKLIAHELEKIQIFINDDNLIEKVNSAESCLIHCLEYNKVDPELITQIKLSMTGNTIPICKLNDLFLKNNIRLDLFTKGKVLTFGDKKSKKIVKMCLSDEHYYPYIDINITEFSIKNIDYEVYKLLSSKQKENWFKIARIDVKNNGKSYYKYDTRRSTIKSNKLVELILTTSKSFLEPIKFSSETIKLNSYDKLDDNKLSLDNKKELDIYQEIKPKENKKTNEYDFKIFFDFETITENIHRTYMVCYRIYMNNKRIHDNCITGLDCEKKFLDNVKDFIYKQYYKIKGKAGYKNEKINNIFKITLLAHNITYDFNFLMKYGKRMNICERGSGLVCGGTFSYYGIIFNLKDTYALIPDRLSKFPELFNLKDTEKEIMPYKLYTEKSVQKKQVKIKEALEHLKPEEHTKFMDNLKKWKLISKIDNVKYFDHMEYSRIYCKLDIEIMCTGYYIFKEWIQKDLKIDIDNFLTISSIADNYFINQGCYTGCYKLTGIARFFIQKCVVGGRCMPADNNSQLSKEELNDFDGVSLYPSAMERLGKLGGFLMGKPKQIINKSFNFLKKQDGYFIKVRFKINTLPIRRSFPLLSSINKEGTRIFSNNIEKEHYYLDKISIEDLITFHNVKKSDIEIVDGYYFNEGRNNNIHKTIRYVFDKRVEYKNIGNPIQNLYKLIMNSCYGKNIMKERPSKKVFFDSKESMLKYVYRNYNHVESKVTQIIGSDKWFVSVYNPIHNHYNSCHIGSEILSMSKRIMNEVMCLAEDTGVKIYYQDTDSMHIQNNKINKLNEDYIEKHGRELIGKKLGQFHNDFADVKINGELVKADCAVSSIFLGKKSYIDKVRYLQNGKEHFEYHIRMKSIPTGCISYHPDYQKGKTPFDMYQDLYNGETITFNLLKNGVPGFVNERNGQYSTRNVFERSVSFSTVDNTEYESAEEYFMD